MRSMGQSSSHESAHGHVRGEALYIADMPPLHHELWVDLVGSPTAHGRIRSLDVTRARQIPGIIIYTAADVSGHKKIGPVLHDEEVLASEVCQYLGQPVALVAGPDKASVEAARALVKVDVEPLAPVMSIEEALARKQLLGPVRRIARGDVVRALEEAEHRLEGEINIGGQEHFYLEAQAALAVPGEDGQITVYSSTQHPSEVQAIVANGLGLQVNQVICVCKRMGGGFGGKETQAALPALWAALVAFKTRRPARIVLHCDTDFQITGKRHPYLARFEVGFTREGRITALRTAFFSNGGFSADLSMAVMERTLLHAENAYFIPNVDFTGTVCRTNLPSNTAFRGFGGPQAVIAMECVIEEMAARLGLDPLHIRRLNCYGEDKNNETPYGQIVSNNTLPAVIDQLTRSADYDARRATVHTFNATSRTHLKGIALTPVKFGISFTRRTLNQANALVNVFLDGTVQVSTGGTEMGQGLFTKLRQVAADGLGLPLQAIRMMPTSTEKNINTSPTAASASTDLNGAAVETACRDLRQRLAPVAARMLALEGIEPSPAHITFLDGFLSDARHTDRRVSFVQVVKQAYEERVDLGARGFYATPGVDFNRETGKGCPFLYYTIGAAVAEVLIDRFTGELEVGRLDLLLDIGRPVNPAIDKGQIIGGFVQGMGWVTTEELRYGPGGELWTASPTTYKVPNVTDVPADFRVDFLDNPTNTQNLYASKAVGEPPLLLAACVWAAVKQALADAGCKPPRLDLPATNEEILLRLSARPELPTKNGVAEANGASAVPELSTATERG